jgi:HPt (histidine-containing phosphotransfer) domain-containing protein
MVTLEELEARVKALENKWRLTDREPNTMRQIASIALEDLNQRFERIETLIVDNDAKNSARFDAMQSDIHALITAVGKLIKS